MSAGGVASSLGALRQFAGVRRPQEICELCATPLRGEHEHLVSPKERKLVCVCTACAILFSAQAGSRYKRVPRQIRFLADFHLNDAQWEGLMIPINLAFFFESSSLGKAVAQYPSPAGATESLLPLDTWNDLVDQNPALKGMAPDVEALLANRLGPGRGYAAAEYFLAPIDECYKLVWLIRTHWRGLSGGSELWQLLDAFFADLKARSGAPYA